MSLRRTLHQLSFLTEHLMKAALTGVGLSSVRRRYLLDSKPPLYASRSDTEGYVFSNTCYSLLTLTYHTIAERHEIILVGDVVSLLIFSLNKSIRTKDPEDLLL